MNPNVSFPGSDERTTQDRSQETVPVSDPMRALPEDEFAVHNAKFQADLKAAMGRIEKDPKMSRRAAIAVSAAAFGAATWSLLDTYSNPPKKAASVATPSPETRDGEFSVASAETPSLEVESNEEITTSSEEEVTVVCEETTESVEPIVQKSVWEREPGAIKKGEIIYTPVKHPNGKTQFISLQFVDEDGQTLLIVNGNKCGQTSRGMSIFVREITLSADKNITIEGKARMFSGSSVWNAEKISEMHAQLDEKGEFPFTVTSFLGNSPAIIRRLVEAKLPK